MKMIESEVAHRFSTINYTFSLNIGEFTYYDTA